MYKISKLTDFLALVGLFCGGLYTLGGVLPFAVTQVVIIMLFILILTKNLLLNKVILSKFLTFVLGVVVITSFCFNHQYFDNESLQSLIGLVIYFSAYYWYVQDNKDNLLRLVRSYIFFCTAISVIGFIQEFGWLTGIEYLYDFSHYAVEVNNITTSGMFLRIYSITSEPAHLAFVLLPAVYFSLLRFINKSNEVAQFISKPVAIINIAAMLMTFSLVGYLSIVIIVAFILTATRVGFLKSLITVVIGIAVVISSYMYIPNINLKVASLFVDRQNLVTSSNLSSFALISNMLVAKDSFIDSPLSGTGINTHRYSYDKYIGKYFRNILFELNKTGDASMYIRIPSELGIIGIFLVLFLFIRFKIKFKLNSYCNLQLYFINQMALISILAGAIRNGNYLDPLFVFLIALYIYSYNTNKYQLKRQISVCAGIKQ
ncbi:MAG TPA: hypothetical protein DF296_02625 [Candidatus Margulisbacteria bacterium]|nr:MAG: hypothetical protein A2X43_05890 [Candidatus Margulisbacteria bacterium GWD2_39_127]HCT84074.1 hypothetical protein [Candidatus Margulisiibacteriota bacterium]